MAFRSAERDCGAEWRPRTDREEDSMSDGRLNWQDAAFSRRSFLKFTLAAGATMSLAEFIAACGSGSTNVPAGKRVDSIAYGQIGSESSINPLNTLGHSESYW